MEKRTTVKLISYRASPRQLVDREDAERLRDWMELNGNLFSDIPEDLRGDLQRLAEEAVRGVK